MRSCRTTSNAWTPRQDIRRVMRRNLGRVLALSIGIILAGGALPALAQIGLCEPHKLTAYDAPTGDHFGRSVSISGDVAVIGAPWTDEWGPSSGSAYVFRRDDNGTPSDPSDDFWVEQAKLIASDAAEGDQFGYSVSISGDVAVIGAHLDDDGGHDSGSAYVFEKPPGGWEDMTETAKLTAPDAPPNEYFGYSVSISGDVAVIGAFYHAGAGAAYVFRRDDDGTPSDPSDDSWVKEAILSASDAAEGDWFGYSVSISGDVAVIGAPWDCLLYTSPSPRDRTRSRMPSSA